MTAMPLPLRRLEVPMNDLGAQYQQIKGEVDVALAGVMEEQSFILGPQVQRFEADYAAYCRVDHGRGVELCTLEHFSLLVSGSPRPARTLQVQLRAAGVAPPPRAASLSSLIVLTT